MAYGPGNQIHLQPGIRNILQRLRPPHTWVKSAHNPQINHLKRNATEGPTLIAWKVSLFIIAAIHKGLARLGTFALITATKIGTFSSLVAISTA